jgi:manganese efflux pump family protein
MPTAALISWIATAGGGSVLLATWLAHGGLRQRHTGRTRFSMTVLISHIGLAVIGLVVWILSILTDTNGLRWLALALLPVVAAIGVSMFVLWLGGRGAHAGLHEIDPPAEQHFPSAVVIAHGAFAAVTVALVALAAFGIGN